MRSIRVTSFLLAFACTLALVGCQHTASKTTQSNQGAGSQAQAASAQAERANAQTQPANVPAQSTSNSDQSAGGSGSARLAPPAGPTQTAAPEPPAQDAQATHPDQSTQPSQKAQAGTEAADNRVENQRPRVIIPDGAPVEIRLTQSLGSARSVSGQSFAATLDAPIVVDNAVVVARGANVTGRVLYAKRSGSAISSGGRVTGHLPNRDPHLYQNTLAMTAPLAHAKRPPPGGYVQTRFPEK